jgi:hydrogenase expression/formation protein HypC
MCLAVPGELLDATGDDPLTRVGRVSFGGVVRSVSLAYVPEARPGDYLVVHAGFALSVLDQEQAAEVFAALEQLSAATGPESG